MRSLGLSGKVPVTYEQVRLGERDEADQHMAGRRVRFSDRRACRLRRDARKGPGGVSGVDADGFGHIRRRVGSPDSGGNQFPTD